MSAGSPIGTPAGAMSRASRARAQSSQIGGPSARQPTHEAGSAASSAVVATRRMAVANPVMRAG